MGWMMKEGPLGALEPEDGYYMVVGTKINSVGGRGKDHVSITLFIGRETDREYRSAEEVLRVSGFGKAKMRRALSFAATALYQGGFLTGVKLKV